MQFFFDTLLLKSYLYLQVTNVLIKSARNKLGRISNMHEAVDVLGHPKNFLGTKTFNLIHRLFCNGLKSCLNYKMCYI